MLSLSYAERPLDSSLVDSAYATRWLLASADVTLLYGVFVGDSDSFLVGVDDRDVLYVGNVSAAFMVRSPLEMYVCWWIAPESGCSRW